MTIEALNALQTEADGAYRDIVLRLAKGDVIDRDALARTLVEAGKSPHDAQADVAVAERRLQALDSLATIPAIDARRLELKAERAALQQQIDALQQEHALRLRPLQERLRALQDEDGRLNSERTDRRGSAQQTLRDTADPALHRELRQLAAEIDEFVANQVKPLQAEVDRRRRWRDDLGRYEDQFKAIRFGKVDTFERDPRRSDVLRLPPWVDQREPLVSSAHAASIAYRIQGNPEKLETLRASLAAVRELVDQLPERETRLAELERRRDEMLERVAAIKARLESPGAFRLADQESGADRRPLAVLGEHA